MNCVIDLEGINGNANVTAIPYIDRFFGRRFRRQGFLTVKDVIMFFHNKTQDEAKNQLTRLLQNPRRNTCLANRYHVADFNVCGYNAIRLLLLRAANNWRSFGIRRRPNLPALPVVSRGHTSAKRCTCLDEDACRGTRICRYIANRCYPRFGPGFEGVATFPGQRGNQNVSGLRYNRGWRVARRTPLRRLPRKPTTIAERVRQRRRGRRRRNNA